MSDPTKPEADKAAAKSPESKPPEAKAPEAKAGEAPKPPADAKPADGKPAATAPAKPPEPPLSPVEEARRKRVAREKELADKLAGRMGDAVKGRVSFRDQECLTLDRARAFEALKFARDELGFNVLTDVTAIDYLKLDGHPERFAVVWELLALDVSGASPKDRRPDARLRLKAYLPEEDPRVATASTLWRAADWGEREAYDMFGITFEGHPNLVRILMPADYGSFPLRKDYPLRGRGERDNFPVLKRGATEADS